MLYPLRMMGVRPPSVDGIVVWIASSGVTPIEAVERSKYTERSRTKQKAPVTLSSQKPP